MAGIGDAPVRNVLRATEMAGESAMQVTKNVKSAGL
jgi:hypothetical protein